MRIYIAGASAESDLVSFYRDRVVEAGHTITHDWVRAIKDSGGVANPRDRSVDALRTFAIEDLRGVEAADVFWLVTPTDVSSGCWVEAGYALAIKQRRVRRGDMTIVVSGDWKKSIFCALADMRFDLHSDAMAWIKAQR